VTHIRAFIKSFALRWRDDRDSGVYTWRAFRLQLSDATVTALLAQGVALEDVQYLAGRADPRTTRLYDRRQMQFTRNTVERISI
jgi:site-specific recombinase XerD